MKKFQGGLKLNSLVSGPTEERAYFYKLGTVPDPQALLVNLYYSIVATVSIIPIMSDHIATGCCIMILPFHGKGSNFAPYMALIEWAREHSPSANGGVCRFS